MMMKAAKLGWAVSGAGQEQTMSRPGAGWEQARSRLGVGQEQWKSREEARVEQEDTRHIRPTMHPHDD